MSAVPGAPRPLPRWRRAVLHVAAASWQLTRRRRAERRRASLVSDLGFPARRHPESVTAELPGRDEEWLAALAAGLWPDDEYAEILRCYPPRSRPGGDQL